MKTLKTIALFMLIGAVIQSCQKDEKESFNQFEAEQLNMKSGAVNFNCETDCIDPENPVWFENTDQKVIGWAGPDNDRFSKTVDIIYYNTFENFVLKVKSTEAIANLLVDGDAVKDFSNPIPAGTWHTLTFELDENWEACDEYGFELVVIGNGPQAVFDVQYQLLGECNPDNAFITTWNDVANFILTGPVNVTIDWGDGTVSTVTDPGWHGKLYTYGGVYTVSITGSATGFQANYDPEWEFATTLVSVDNWGKLGFQSLAWAFEFSPHLISVPDNTLGLEGVTNMEGMFYGASSFNQDISGWDVSNVTNMAFMFAGASSFNQDIGDWDVSNVSNMDGMFTFASSFNQDLSGWCVSNISTQPSSFDLGANNWALPRPVWGTCP